jgi:hypothetical protein
MATLSITLRALDRATAGFPPQRMLELGAGDGSLMLRLARRRAARWPDVQVTLLDRLGLVPAGTLAGLRAVGWTPEFVSMDVFDWLGTSTGPRSDVVMSNLFVHHFSSRELTDLLAGIAARTRVFFCCEPRRSVLPLAGSHLIGLLGAGSVTRHDAPSSVHAGFRGKELSDLWPDAMNWTLHEYPAGLFSHCFLAIRKSP